MTAELPSLLALSLMSANDTAALPFSPGEELVYRVKALGLRSGVATFDVGAAEQVGEVSVWPIVMAARSEGITEQVFPIRDRFVSFWDPVARLPVQAELTANEAGRKRSMLIQFQRAAPAHADVRVRDEGKDPVAFHDPMHADAQDFQAAVYWLRTRPLKVGDREVVPIVAGKRQWSMTAIVSAAVSLDVPAGRFEAVKVQVSTSFVGKFQSRGTPLAYFSNDARHLPLRFEADLVLGKMVAELVSCSPEP